MLNFTKDEMKKYVEGLLPDSEIIYAKKLGNTIAVQGKEGQHVITYEIDTDGNQFVEREGNVSIDPKTGEPGWILTKTDSDNKPVINEFGNVNQYIVPDSKFKSMYEESLDGPGLYSKSQIEKFIKAPEDVTFETKYGEMTVKKGGYIKMSNLDNISGISEISFGDTYKEVVDPVLLKENAKKQTADKLPVANPEKKEKHEGLPLKNPYAENTDKQDKAVGSNIVQPNEQEEHKFNEAYAKKIMEEVAKTEKEAGEEREDLFDVMEAALKQLRKAIEDARNSREAH